MSDEALATIKDEIAKLLKMKKALDADAETHKIIARGRVVGRLSPEAIAALPQAWIDRINSGRVGKTAANHRNRQAHPSRTWTLLREDLPVSGFGATAPIMREIAALMASDMVVGKAYSDQYVVDLLVEAVENEPATCPSLAKSVQSVTFHLDYFTKGKCSSALIIGYEARGFLRRDG